MSASPGDAEAPSHQCVEPHDARPDQYNPPSRFLDEIPSELINEIGGTRMLRCDVIAAVAVAPTAAVAAARFRQAAPSVVVVGILPDDVVESAIAAANTPTSGAESIGLKVGDDVRHSQWGEGVIVEIDGVGDKRRHRSISRRSDRSACC